MWYRDCQELIDLGGRVVAQQFATGGLLLLIHVMQQSSGGIDQSIITNLQRAMELGIKLITKGLEAKRVEAFFYRIVHVEDIVVN